METEQKLSCLDHIKDSQMPRITGFQESENYSIEQKTEMQKYMFEDQNIYKELKHENLSGYESEERQAQKCLLEYKELLKENLNGNENDKLFKIEETLLKLSRKCQIKKLTFEKKDTRYLDERVEPEREKMMDKQLRELRELRDRQSKSLDSIREMRLQIEKYKKQKSHAEKSSIAKNTTFSIIKHQNCELTWKELNPVEKSRIREAKVNFQGRILTFESFACNDEEIYEALSHNEIVTLLNGKQIKFNKINRKTLSFIF